MRKLLGFAGRRATALAATAAVGMVLSCLPSAVADAMLTAPGRAADPREAQMSQRHRRADGQAASETPHRDHSVADQAVRETPQRFRLTAVWQSPVQESTLNRPEGIDVAEDGLLAIAERGSHRVTIWHADGQAAARWGRQGSAPGDFEAPEDVAVDLPRARVYVADSGNRRVQVLDRANGRVLAIWPDVGRPHGIVVDAEGLVYVADGESGSIRLFDAEGRPRGAWRAAEPGPEIAGHRFDPRGLSIGPDGLVYVADHAGQRVLWFDRTGVVVGQLALDNRGAPGGAPLDAAVDARGNLYVAVARGVLRFSARATYAELILPRRAVLDPNCPFPDRSRCPRLLLPIPENHEGVRRLAVRPDGGLYFTYAPQLRIGDAAFAFPARGLPSVIGAEAGGTLKRAVHPSRLDVASDPFAVHVLDTSGQVRAYRDDGRPYDTYHDFRNGPGIDIAADPLRPDVTGVLTGNQVSLSSLRDFEGRAPRLTEVLEPTMLTRYDRVGDRVSDPRWWNIALTMRDGLRAVLDAGRGRLVVRAEPDQLAAAIRLQPETAPFRAFRDLDYDRQGNLWVLARDGEILRYDQRGRGLDPLLPEGFHGHSAEALATAGDGGGAVLTGDGWVVRFDPRGRLLAAWRPAETGGPGEYLDVAIDDKGRVLVPDAAADRLLVFEATEGPGGPLPAPERGACQVTPQKRAAPSRLVLGETTGLTLQLDARCDLDVVLVVDTSCQASGERLNQARRAVAAFADVMTQPADRLALVTFSDQLGSARLLVPLTADRFAVRDAGLALEPSCMPIAWFPDRRAEGRISDGLRAGREALFGPQARPGVAKALILVSPSILDREIHERQLYGRWIAGSIPPVVSEREHAIWEARQLWQAGVTVYAVGVGEDNRPLGPPPEPTPDLISTHPADDGLLASLAYPAGGFRSAGTPAALPPTLRQIGTELSSRLGFAWLVVTDRLPDNMRFVPGSAQPPAEQPDPSTLRWTFSTTDPTSPPAIRFQLEPLQTGVWPTNVEALATYEDGFGHRGNVAFPIPTVEVLMPTALPSATAPPSRTPASATATATATASPSATAVTPTPTPPPLPRYLPLLMVDRCVPKTAPVDIVLVVDTSSSMAGAKLEAAVEAVRTFLGLLRLPRDQAAVVAFHSRAILLQELTGSRDLLDQALDRLTTERGTRIDLGLEAAIAAAVGSRSRPTADPVIVLLTDGRTQGGSEADALDAAARAHQLGITVYAIGLGGDVMPDFLLTIAGDRGRLFLSPSEADLRAIYTAIARAIPCR